MPILTVFNLTHEKIRLCYNDENDMELTGNTILITGGSNGIGLALATRFAKRGNEVIICGRDEEKLSRVKDKVPQFHTKVCDVGDEKQRAELYNWAIREFPR